MQSIKKISSFCCDADNASCCGEALKEGGNRTMITLPLWGAVWMPGTARLGSTNGGDGDEAGRNSNGTGDDPKGGFDASEVVSVVIGIVFGVPTLAMAWLQYRHVKKEGRALNLPTGPVANIRRIFRLWFPRRSLRKDTSTWAEEVENASVELVGVRPKLVGPGGGYLAIMPRRSILGESVN